MTAGGLPIWTRDAAVAATGGHAPVDWAAGGVSIDTRDLARGDLFVALRDVRDGHDFVAQALARGAAAALVSRVPEGVGADAPLLLVPDVLEGLEALGRAARARTRARVAAVTGSVGKTSTKEMLRAILAGQGRVHAAERSFNNHWGVPLTLARMPQDADFAVIEIGMNHPGEIAPLAAMARPHVAMVTTIAAAHLEAFADLDGIAREKAAIFSGLEPEGVAVIPGDLPQAGILAAAAQAAGARLLRFGEGPGCDWRLTEIALSAGRAGAPACGATVVHAAAPGEDFLFKVMTLGRHFAVNALGALATAEALGADRGLAILDIAHWVPPAGRGGIEEIVLDIVDDDLRFILIDDAFNANPASLGAALEVLAAVRPQDGLGRRDNGRRVAVLGDMLELGPDEIALHTAIARHPAMASVDVVHCVGPRMRHLWDALPDEQRGEWAPAAEDLAHRAAHLVDAGDAVLVKGSKGSKVSLVVEALRKLGQVRARQMQEMG